MVLLALLVGCTADVPPPVAPVEPAPIDLGPSFSERDPAAYGCGWAYLYAPANEDWTPPILTASLSLPAADATGATDVSYDRDLHGADHVSVLLPDGDDDVEYATCTDATGWAEGVRRFTAESGHLSFDATSIGSYSTSACGGPPIAFAAWEATVELTDVQLSDSAGATAYLDSFEAVVRVDTGGCVGP